MELADRLGADPRELIPCYLRTKKSIVRNFTRLDYGTNWNQFFNRNQGREANVALLFGNRGRFVGLDCDSGTALDRVRDLLTRWPHVRTARGCCLIARCDDDVSAVTGSAFVRITVDGTAAGELRMQRCYSLLHGVHPSGALYELKSNLAPVLNLPAFVEDLAERGFSVPPLQPPLPALEFDPARGDGVVRFWAHQAACLGSRAPARNDATVGTDSFVFAMTTELRARPYLAEAVVRAFATAVEMRGLAIRGGAERLMIELCSRLAKWAQSYGAKVRHVSLKTHFAPFDQKAKQDTQNVLFRFLADADVRADQRDLVGAVVTAFISRARITANEWAYEATTALLPDVPPATFARAVHRAVAIGLLERAENDFPSSRPAHLTARWKFRVSERGLNLDYGAQD